MTTSRSPAGATTPTAARPSYRPADRPDDTGFQVIFARLARPRGVRRRRQRAVAAGQQPLGRGQRLRRRDRQGRRGRQRRPRASPPATTTRRPRRRRPRRSRCARRSSSPARARTPTATSSPTCGSRTTRAATRAPSLVDNKKKNGPLFRVFGTIAPRSRSTASLESPSPNLNIANGNPTRYFPDLAQVLDGNTNAATGSARRSRRCRTTWTTTCRVEGQGRSTATRSSCRSRATRAGPKPSSPRCTSG